MSRRRRLSEDAVGSLPWVRKTTEKAEEPKPANQQKEKAEEPKPARKARPKPKKSRAAAKSKAAAKSASQRFVNIEYDKNDGTIIATHEVLGEAEEASGPWTNIPADMATSIIVLTGDLFDKDLIDIHINYKVVVSRKKPTLVPKD